jgi:sugar transferase (PEP-CTERM/EpsH1 system associated)
MDKIKVFHIALSLEIGGLEQVVINLVRNLDRNRFEPVIACLNERGALADEISQQKINVIKIDPMPSRLSYLFPTALVEIIKREKPDIIHSHSGCWYKSVRAAYLTQINNVIHTDHGRLIPDSLSARWLDRFYSKYTTRIIAVSEQLRRYLIERVKISASKIEVIYNGVPDIAQTSSVPSGIEINPLLISDARPIIGTIGRLAPVKDYSTLLFAMQVIHTQVKNAKLVVIGDGSERSKLEHLAEELGIKQAVLFLGSRRDVAQLYPTFTIFALSSISEGTSMSILEAMAFGKPIVATDVGGNRYLVQEGKTGILVPPKQPQLLAAALLNLIHNQAQARDMGAAGRVRYLNLFTVGKMARNYEQLYEKLVASRQ